MCLSDLMKSKSSKLNCSLSSLESMQVGGIVPENDPLDETAELLLLIDPSEVKRDDPELEIVV